MSRFALCMLSLWTLGAGCVAFDHGTGDATLAVENMSVADQLEVALVPIDTTLDPSGDQAEVDGGDTVVLFAQVGLYDLVLVDHAGDGCLIRQFAFLAGDEQRAVIYDWDLVDCTEPPLERLPEVPWE